jgi:LmbE family N-acetylglucosaminyl deacetylase
MNQLSNFNKVLVLSPHTDDAELGAGGTIARFIDEGKEVHYIAFSLCETSVPEGWAKDTLKKECSLSLKNLGIIAERIHMLNYPVRTFPEHRQEILDDLIKFKNDIIPDLVLVPSSQDMHQDHGVIYWEALRAFKKDSSIWGYEHPWNNLTFTTDIFISLNEEHLERKIRALREYLSQRIRSYMDERNIRSLAITRGAQLDLSYAEVFELIRLIY